MTSSQARILRKILLPITHIGDLAVLKDDLDHFISKDFSIVKDNKDRDVYYGAIEICKSLQTINDSIEKINQAIKGE